MLVQSSKLKVRPGVQGRIGEVRASARWAPRLLVVVAAWHGRRAHHLSVRPGTLNLELNPPIPCPPHDPESDPTVPMAAGPAGVAAAASDRPDAAASPSGASYP